MARPLDPISLQLFVTVCEEGSIARAAAREALVASALSKRLAALEAEVGTTLLLRRRRGVEPTPAGQALLARAREVLAGLDRVRLELAAYGEGVQGSLRVLASPSVVSRHLPQDLAAFCARHPAIRLGLDERMSVDIVRGVREGTADLGVLWGRIDLTGLDVRPYRQDRLCVVLPRSHPLAGRSALRFEDTLEAVSISVVPGGQVDQLLRRQAALIGRVPAYRMSVQSIEAACRLAAAGLGLAVLPEEAIGQPASLPGLVQVPLAESWAVRQLVIVTRSPPLRSATCEHLMEALTQPDGH